MEGSAEKTRYVEFSIIIPVLYEQENINRCVDSVLAQSWIDGSEVIVVDGDPHGETIKAIDSKLVKGITSPAGRGRQMNAGAARASGRVLLFLHADTLLPEGGLSRILEALEDEEIAGGAFSIEYETKRLGVKFVAWTTWLRSRVMRIPYGDQAIFIRKDYFEAIGGYADIPIMEDTDLMRRVKKEGWKIAILDERVRTSDRRWVEEGVVYSVVRNAVLLGLFCMGVRAEKLAKFYKSRGKV